MCDREEILTVGVIMTHQVINTDTVTVRDTPPTTNTQHPGIIYYGSSHSLFLWMARPIFGNSNFPPTSHHAPVLYVLAILCCLQTIYTSQQKQYVDIKNFWRTKLHFSANDQRRFLSPSWKITFYIETDKYLWYKTFLDPIGSLVSTLLVSNVL